VRLEGCFVLIAGSASAEASSELLADAANAVRRLVSAIVREGGGIVLFTGAPEPVSTSGQPLIFDWLALEEIEREPPSRSQRAVVVTSSKARSRMTPARQALLNRLTERGIVRLVAIPDDVHTGGNISDAQVREADAFIAIGGGMGVADRAGKMRRKGGVILPFDARIGALGGDGTGSVGLYQQAVSSPEHFAPHAPDVLAEALPFLTVHAASPDLAVHHTIQVLVAERAARDDARMPEVVLLTALPVELDATRRTLGIVTDPRKTSGAQTCCRARRHG
jgi:hypothetical protein